MSGRQTSDNLETLFSFELLVEHIRIEKESQVSDELAVGVRLLDFATLLIYQPRQSGGGGVRRQESRGRGQQGEYAFNRGKSCLFKMNLNSLHAHLSNTPLYAMVLDVKEETPKLVGTSLLSLATVMDRIWQDVAEHGASTPSSHGERGLVGICSLTGERTGSISLTYKLVCLGASLLPHIAETSVHGGQHVQESIMEKHKCTELLPLGCRDVRSPTLDTSAVSRNTRSNKASNEKTLNPGDKRNCGVHVTTETRSQLPQTLKETDNSFEEDLAPFCPPRLFYSNSEKNCKNEGVDCKLLNLDSEAFAFDDTCSEDETDENRTEGTRTPVIGQRVRHGAKTPRNQETSGVTPNVLGEALQQLPLLNALLVELSQLNDRSPHQPLSVHPSLAWIYRPASTEPPAGHGHAARKAQTKLLQKTTPGASSHVTHLHSPRKSSTPVVRPTSVKVKDKQEAALVERKSSSASPRKRLVYGTTKTFNLRRKKNSGLAVKHRECVELIQKETPSSEEKTQSSNKIAKSSKRKSVLNPSSTLNENVETMIESIRVDSAPQGTITGKHQSLRGKGHDKQDGGSPRISEKPSPSERGSKCIHSRSVDSDSVAHNDDANEHHGEWNQSQSDSVRRTEQIESPGSGRRSSPKSSSSDSSGEGNEEADYADDFNSLEPSDAYSPEPVSSTEPSRAKTPKSPVHTDFCSSDSDGFQKGAGLPVPVEARSSPHHALWGTHVIRPRTYASALSISSDDGDRGGPASLRTACPGKQMAESSSVDRSSDAESFIPSRGQRRESTKNSGPLQGSSADSISSFESREAEEVEDELGSLDFRNEYQHISKLVANKLPGYTM